MAADTVPETFHWHGHITITAHYADGSEEVVADFDNTIMDAGRNLLRDGLYGGSSALIGYVALGSSTTAVSTAQTQLGSEQFRKAVTARSKPGTGQTKTTVYIAPGEATSFTIEEIGWFAGATASGATNSGTMVSRVLYHRAKTNLESLQIDRTDTFS